MLPETMLGMASSTREETVLSVLVPCSLSEMQSPGRSWFGNVEGVALVRVLQWTRHCATWILSCSTYPSTCGSIMFGRDLPKILSETGIKLSRTSNSLGRHAVSLSRQRCFPTLSCLAPLKLMRQDLVVRNFQSAQFSQERSIEFLECFAVQLESHSSTTSLTGSTPLFARLSESTFQ